MLFILILRLVERKPHLKTYTSLCEKPRATMTSEEKKSVDDIEKKGTEDETDPCDLTRMLRQCSITKVMRDGRFGGITFDDCGIARKIKNLRHGNATYDSAGRGKGSMTATSGLWMWQCKRCDVEHACTDAVIDIQRCPQCGWNTGIAKGMEDEGRVILERTVATIEAEKKMAKSSWWQCPLAQQYVEYKV